MAIDEPTKGKGGTPTGDSPHSARTNMGQKISLAHLSLSFLDDGSSISRHIAAAAAAAAAEDDACGSEQMDEELDVDVPRKNTAVDDSDDDFVPLIIMRTKNVKNETGKHPGFRYKHKAQRTITKNDKRKKTGRPAGSKRYGKRKTEKKAILVDNTNISKRSNKDTDVDFEPEIPDDDGRKKYASALDRALEVENKLPAEGPSFVKLMRKSHVVKGFWLGVPLSFCRNHLPNDDVTIALEDEDGLRFDTNYKQGLSGGWHGFVVRHGLKVGDAVIFQLVGPKRFKVYILRENKFSTTDEALGLLSLDTSMENNIPDKEETWDEDVKSKKDLDLTRVRNKMSDDDSNDLFSEAEHGGIGLADPDPDFNAVMKTFRAFKTTIDSSVIDRELVPDHQLWTYYKLCGARKAFLHRRLPKQINPTLAAGVIAETASIAEGIRSSSSSLEDLAVWKKTLESLELLGMDVGFMRTRVDELLFLLSDARPSADHHAPEPEGYEEVMKLERARAAEKVRALESKMASLKDALREMDVEMEEIAEERRRGHAVLQLAAAPW